MARYTGPKARVNRRLGALIYDYYFDLRIFLNSYFLYYLHLIFISYFDFLDFKP